MAPVTETMDEAATHPAKHLVDEKYTLKDLVNIEELERPLELFSAATGLAINLIAHPGEKIILRTGWQDICTQFHQACPESKKRCWHSFKMLTEKFDELQQIEELRCDNGLIIGATPVIVKGKHVASLLAGQIFHEPPDREQFRIQAEKYKFDEKQYLSTVDRVPVMSQEQFEKVLRLLSEIASQIAQFGLNNLSLQESQEKYKAIFDQTFQFIGLMTPDGILLEANQTAIDFGGIKEADVIGKPFWETPWWSHSKEMQQMVHQGIEKAAGGEFVRFVADHLGPNGETFYVDVSIKPVFDRDGKIKFLIPEGREITDRIKAEEELRRSEEKFRTLFETMTLGVLYHDAEGKIISANPAFEKIIGLKLDSIQGKTADESEVRFIKTDGSELSIEERPSKIALSTGKEVKDVIVGIDHPAREGYVWVNLHATPQFRMGESTPYQVHMIFEDITDRLRAENELKESEERWQRLVRKNPASIAVHSDGKVVYANEACLTLVGAVRLEEVYNKPVIEFVHPDYRGLVFERTRQIMESKDFTTPMEEKFLRLDGSAVDVEVSSLPISYMGKPSVLTVFWDISERKKAEHRQKLHVHFLESLERIDQVIRHARDLDQMLYDIMAATQSIFGSDRAWLFHPLDPTAPSFRVPVEVCNPEYPGAFDMNVDVPVDAEMAADQENFLASESPLTSGPGNDLPLPAMLPEKWRVQSQMAMAIYPRVGRPWMIGMHQCSHARRWTVEEKRLFREIGGRVADGLSNRLILKDLEESQERFDLAVKGSQDGIWDWPDVNHDAQWWSPRSYEMLGYTPGEVEPSVETWLEMVHPDDKDRVLRTIQDHIAGKIDPYDVEYRIKRKSGEYAWVRVKGQSIRDEEGRPRRMSGSLQDITNRKLAEQRFRVAAHLGSDLIFEWDLDSDEILWFGEVDKALGLQPGVLPRTLQGFMERIHPDDLIASKDILERHRSSSDPFIHEFRVRHANDSWLNWQALGAPVLDDQGQPYNWIGVCRDITESIRTEQEIRALNRELEERVIKRTAQLEATNQELESFSYSVSHDLRAPLRSIKGFSQALLEDYDAVLDDTGKNYLNRLHTAVHRMDLLVEALRNLSLISRHEITEEIVDFSKLADEIIAELQETDPDRKVIVQIQPDLIVNGDVHLLGVLLRNLFDNAWKFTRLRPEAVIEFGQEVIDGKKVFLVRDNGAGFGNNYAQKIFGAFQRYHSADEFEGTGIGLATVKRIITKHGGEIWAEAEEGKGATFYFTL